MSHETNEEDDGYDERMMTESKKIREHLAKGTRTMVAKSFMDTLDFKVKTKQQCALDFLQKWMELLRRRLITIDFDRTVQVEHTNRCQGPCKHISKRTEDELDITIAVRATLEKSIEQFLRKISFPEIKCKGCLFEVQRGSQFVTLPKSLVIVMKRFNKDLEKINVDCSIPEFLDIEPFRTKEALVKLPNKALYQLKVEVSHLRP